MNFNTQVREVEKTVKVWEPVFTLTLSEAEMIYLSALIGQSNKKMRLDLVREAMQFKIDAYVAKLKDENIEQIDRRVVDCIYHEASNYFESVE